MTDFEDGLQVGGVGGTARCPSGITQFVLTRNVTFFLLGSPARADVANDCYRSLTQNTRYLLRCTTFYCQLIRLRWGSSLDSASLRISINMLGGSHSCRFLEMVH
jgi:hypothetical protein